MFSCGTKRAIPSVSGQDRPVLPPNHITVFTPLAELATYYSFLAVQMAFTFYSQLYICMYLRVGDFLKTNRTKSAAIRLKSLQKAGFLTPISSKITPTKEKEREKRKSQKEERRRREKSNGCTLGFQNGYFGDRFWPKINCRAEEVYLAIRFSKIWPDLCMCINIRKNLVVLVRDESTFLNQQTSTIYDSPFNFCGSVSTNGRLIINASPSPTGWVITMLTKLAVI